MALTDHTKLDIAILAFYVPALILALLIAFRHGFGRQQGWLMIVILAVARIIGSACGIALQFNETDATLITIAAVLGNIGLSFLTNALIGLIQRVNEGMENGKGINNQPPRLLGIVLIVGVILSIIGGTKESDYSDPSTVASGRNYFKAAVMLFLVSTVLFGGLLVVTTAKWRYVIHSERLLLWGVLASYPLLVIRLIYSIVCAFADTKTFNLFHPDVIVQAFMSILEEFLIVIIIIAVGFLTPVISRASVNHSGQSAARRGPLAQMLGQHSNV